MKKNILFFYCLLVVAVVSLKAQEIRPCLLIQLMG